MIVLLVLSKLSFASVYLIICSTYFCYFFLVPDLPLDDSVAPASRPDLLEIPVSEGFSGVYIDSS